MGCRIHSDCCWHAHRQKTHIPTIEKQCTRSPMGPIELKFNFLLVVLSGVSERETIPKFHAVDATPTAARQVALDLHGMSVADAVKIRWGAVRDWWV